MKSKFFPQHVAIIDPQRPDYSCCLKLIKKESGVATYYRHAGEWAVKAKHTKSGTLKTFPNEEHILLSNKRLVKVEREQWRACNGDCADEDHQEPL